MRVLSALFLAMVTTCCIHSAVFAGSLDSTAAPDTTNSYTLDDIWKRLNYGTTGSQSFFTEPSSGPMSGTGHTLNQIMSIAPATDNTNGVFPGDVLNGRTFWGLNGGAWGLQTGTLATQTLSDAGTTVSAGYYNATTLDAVDSDLIPANIVSGNTIFGVSGTASAAAYPAPVPKTGQTKQYSTGDDGDLQKGVALPSPRFTDNGDGTVTDNLTGLIWLKNANCTDTVGGIDPTANSISINRLTWNNALTWCNAMADGSCGLTDSSSVGDWRLPNVKELYSLIHFGYYKPPLSNAAGIGQWATDDPFTNVHSYYYFSSSTYAGGKSGAWVVNLYSLVVGVSSKDYAHYVWAVRGGQ